MYFCQADVNLILDFDTSGRAKPQIELTPPDANYTFLNGCMRYPLLHVHLTHISQPTPAELGGRVVIDYCTRKQEVVGLSPTQVSLWVFFKSFRVYTE